MTNTPTPRTDEFISTLIIGTIDRNNGRIAWGTKDIETLVSHARQLEQELNEARVANEAAHAVNVQLRKELNEARQQQEAKVTPALVMDYAKVQAERDQLRKVVDELANIIYFHSLRPQNALDGYNQLPHVQERNTK